MGDTVVHEVMVLRVDMTTMEDAATIAEDLRVMRQTGFRIPIYHGISIASWASLTSKICWSRRPR